MKFDFIWVGMEEGVFESTTTDIPVQIKSKFGNSGIIYFLSTFVRPDPIVFRTFPLTVLEFVFVL